MVEQSRVRSPSGRVGSFQVASRMQELGETIGPTLERALGETISAGGRAVLLLNRRVLGVHRVRRCGCGWVLRCDDCDAGLVFHKFIRLPVRKASGTARPGRKAAVVESPRIAGDCCDEAFAAMHDRRAGEGTRGAACAGRGWFGATTAWRSNCCRHHCPAVQAGADLAGLGTCAEEEPARSSAG